jgi:hypothetical protein
MYRDVRREIHGKRHFFVKNKDIPMTNTAIDMLLPPATVDVSAIRLGGAFRLPPATPVEIPADTGNIRLGGAFRLLDATKDVTDHGRIRLGGAFSLAA